jgi:predicted nucleic acid-binding protein
MVLAKEISARLVILDDAKARLAAQQLGLTVAGTASLIYRAEELQLISSAAALILQLQAVGFRLKL